MKFKYVGKNKKCMVGEYDFSNGEADVNVEYIIAKLNAHPEFEAVLPKPSFPKKKRK